MNATAKRSDGFHGTNPQKATKRNRLITKLQNAENLRRTIGSGTYAQMLDGQISALRKALMALD